VAVSAGQAGKPPPKITHEDVFTLKKFSVPTFVMHGDDDQIVPYADSAPLSAELVKGAVFENLQGFSTRHANDECGPD
jgi:pimeloyl-ACP methyl ester carboxylesterase